MKIDLSPEGMLDWSEKYFGQVGGYLCFYLLLGVTLLILLAAMLWETFVSPGFFWQWLFKNKKARR